MLLDTIQHIIQQIQNVYVELHALYKHVCSI